MSPPVDQPDQSYQALKKPLDLHDLLAKGTHFEVDGDYGAWDGGDVASDGSNNDEEYQDMYENASAFRSPWAKPFDELRQLMRPRGDHLYKRLVKAGDAGAPLVGDNSRVTLHYNAYWEHDGVPFDSSYLRGQPERYYTAYGDMLEGIEAAVRTMRRGEQAQFLIGHQLLYGEMGCPPRIKPRAEAFYIIELLAHDVVGDLDADKELGEEERSKFPLVVEKVRRIHLKGLDFFKERCYRNAAGVFEKAVTVLGYCRLESEAEGREHGDFLVRLYTNLAVCYNRLNNPQRALLMCKEITRLSGGEPSLKALFHEGRAHLKLGEFAKARELLLRARNLQPHNDEINRELRILDSRLTKYKQDERQMWTRAMGNLSLKDGDEAAAEEAEAASQLPASANKDSNGVHDKFEADVAEVLTKFKNDYSMHKFVIPYALTASEVKCARKVAKDLNLSMMEHPDLGRGFIVQRCKK